MKRHNSKARGSGTWDQGQREIKVTSILAGNEPNFVLCENIQPRVEPFFQGGELVSCLNNTSLQLGREELFQCEPDVTRGFKPDNMSKHTQKERK